MKTEAIKINIIQDRNGRPRFIAMENGHWVEYEPQFGLNGFGIPANLNLNLSQFDKKPGLFQQGGFLSKVGEGISGLFRKKDGKNTFIGDLVSDFNKGLATKVGEGVLQPNVQASGQGPFADPNFPGGTVSRVGNVIQPPVKEKNWTPLLIGTGVVVAGGLTWWALSGSKAA